MKNKKWTRVETLFHAAMEKPNNRRERYLKEVAENDNEYTDALKLVRAAEVSADFMSTSIGLEPFSPSFEKGDDIGPWHIGELIGSGGMGEVYKVSRSSEAFEQIGALKVARTKDLYYLKRFELERKILARLEHPNIGRLIDGGQTPQGNPYMVIEYISGQPLTVYATEKNLPLKARLNLFSRLCKSVTHAHGRLVLHRDIKPTNILVGENNQIKLIDFGVAGNIDHENTTSGAVPLTRAYAAPEQLTGGPVSVATDIYALGCVMHELLTGKRVSAENNIDTSLPADLKAIIAKSMRAEPSERYASVALLHADIEHFQNIEPIAARDGGRGYKLSKFVARNKFASIASSLLLIALGVGGIGIYTQMLRAQSALEARNIALEKANHQRYLATASRTTLRDVIGQALEESRDDEVDLLSIIDKTQSEAIEEFQLAPERAAAKLYSLAHLHGSRSDLKRTQDALAVIVAKDAAETRVLAPSLTMNANFAYFSGDVETSVENYNRAIKSMENAPDVFRYELLLAKAQLSEQSGDPENMRAAMIGLLEEADNRELSDDLSRNEVVGLLDSASFLALLLNENELAIENLEKLLEISGDIKGVKILRESVFINNLVGAYMRAGNPKKALSKNETLIQSYKDTIGPSMELGLAHRMHGRLLKGERKFDVALNHYDVAIELLSEYDVENSNMYFIAKIEREKISALLQNPDEALERMEKIAESSGKLNGDSLIIESQYYFHRGDLLGDLGRKDEAMEELERSIKILSKDQRRPDLLAISQKRLEALKSY